MYVATVTIGTLLIALHQVPVGHAFGSVFASVNITGTFPGAAGTTQFYADLPATAKTTHHEPTDDLPRIGLEVGTPKFVGLLG